MRIFVISLATLLLLSPTSSVAETVRVAVAANFKSTLMKINKRFEANSGIRIKLSSASTGALAVQIEHGAPFDVFFSADQHTPDTLQQRLAQVDRRSFCYAVGRLGIVGGSGQIAQLSNPRLSLAIANPATAPYGRAAEQVLARKEFTGGNNRKLIRGNNAVQAYQFWHSNTVDLALIPMSLAVDSATEIPQAWHATLRQHLLVIRRNAAVDAYIKWIESDTVRSLISQAGYDPCP